MGRRRRQGDQRRYLQGSRESEGPVAGWGLLCPGALATDRQRDRQSVVVVVAALDNVMKVNVVESANSYAYFAQNRNAPCKFNRSVASFCTTNVRLPSRSRCRRKWEGGALRQRVKGGDTTDFCPGMGQLRWWWGSEWRFVFCRPVHALH